MEYSICKDNVLCCDDNCQRCANLIYNKYMEQKAKIERLQNTNKRLELAFAAECDLSRCTRESEIKSEAYRELWDRLKKEADFISGGDYGFSFEIREDVAEEIIKELTEENK